MPRRLAGLVIIQIVKIIAHAPCRRAAGDHPVRYEEAGVDYPLFTVYLNAFVIGAKNHASPPVCFIIDRPAEGGFYILDYPLADCRVRQPFISRRQRHHPPAQEIRRALRRLGFSLPPPSYRYLFNGLVSQHLVGRAVFPEHAVTEQDDLSQYWLARLRSWSTTRAVRPLSLFSFLTRSRTLA